jgi:hypothetical protein
MDYITFSVQKWYAHADAKCKFRGAKMQNHLHRLTSSHRIPDHALCLTLPVAWHVSHQTPINNCKSLIKASDQCCLINAAAYLVVEHQGLTELTAQVAVTGKKCSRLT